MSEDSVGDYCKAVKPDSTMGFDQYAKCLSIKRGRYVKFSTVRNRALFLCEVSVYGKSCQSSIMHGSLRLLDLPIVLST